VIELRTYTLASPHALNEYTSHFWPRHIESLRKHGITVHGVWTESGSNRQRVIALIGYPPASDPVLLAQKYIDSDDFTADHADFDVSSIVTEQTVTLTPIPSSPLH
jgi:hypothetical protein